MNFLPLSPKKAASKQLMKEKANVRSNSESSSSSSFSKDDTNNSGSFWAGGTKCRGRSGSFKLQDADTQKMLQLLESMQAKGGMVQNRRKQEAITKINDAIRNTCLIITDMEKRKAENLQLAKDRFYSKDVRSSETANRLVASLCMERYHTFDASIKQHMVVIQSLKKIEWNIDDGRIMPEEVDADLQYILSMASKPLKNVTKYTQEELLQQLQELS